MKRGIFAVLAVLAATFVSPATAAAPSSVVYEVVRRPSAASTAEVEVHDLGGQGPATSMDALLEPLAGGGYDMWAGGAHWSSGGGSGWTRFPVELTGRRRFVAGGTRGRIRIVVKQAGWSVREIGSGFRTVAARGQVDQEVAGTTVARHGRATAPGGSYGSLAWARVPCQNAVGTWSVGTEAEPREEYRCTPFLDDWGSELVTTVRGRRWSVEGEYKGLSSADYALAVLDFPKPAAR
jgi:hypothetical protein